MHGCQQTRPNIGRVRCKTQLELFDQLFNPNHLGEAANLGDAGLRIVDGAGLKHVLEVQVTAGVFTCGSGYSAFATHLCQSLVVFGGPDGLFQPVQIQVVEITTHAQSFIQRPRAVAIHHQAHIRSYGLSCTFNLHGADFMQLDGIKALCDSALCIQSHQVRIGVPNQTGIGFDLGSANASQHLGNAAVLHLARQIPQRNV